MAGFPASTRKGRLLFTPRRSGGAQTRPGPGCQARALLGRSGSGRPTGKTVPERVRRVPHQGAFRAHERTSADPRQNATVRARFEGRVKPAADDAFLNPDLAGAQLAICV